MVEILVTRHRVGRTSKGDWTMEENLSRPTRPEGISCVWIRHIARRLGKGPGKCCGKLSAFTIVFPWYLQLVSGRDRTDLCWDTLHSYFYMRCTLMTLARVNGINQVLEGAHFRVRQSALASIGGVGFPCGHKTLTGTEVAFDSGLRKKSKPTPIELCNNFYWNPPRKATWCFGEAFTFPADLQSTETVLEWMQQSHHICSGNHPQFYTIEILVEITSPFPLSYKSRKTRNVVASCWMYFEFL